MSRILAQLLNADEPIFSFGLHELEKVSGHTSVDVRLMADIAATVSKKTKELTLDPNDTTGKELYHALQAMTALHDKYLADAIACKKDGSLEEQLECIQKALTKLPMAKSCWAMKYSVAKKMLKANPPKRVMKALGYKSIDSMIKRENVAELYSAIRFLETDSYNKKLVNSYKKLSASDFEIREVEVLLLSRDKWRDSADDYIYRKHHNITHVKELGIVMILPIPLRRLKGVVITVMPLAIHYINEIRSYSSFFKLQQVRPDFGAVLAKTILLEPNSTAEIAGHPLHWRIIQRHFGGSHTANPELFEPHVQIEDLYWRKAEEVLFHIEPALKFWEGLDYVARLDDDLIIPLNLMDNAVSYCNGLEYGQHSAGHFREALWNEIYIRYMGQQPVEEMVIKQLNSQVLNKETDVI